MKLPIVKNACVFESGFLSFADLSAVQSNSTINTVPDSHGGLPENLRSFVPPFQHREPSKSLHVPQNTAIRALEEHENYGFLELC